MRLTLISALFAALLVTAISSNGFANEVYPPAVTSIGGSETRFDSTVTIPLAPNVNTHLSEDARQTRLWWWGWLGGFTALTVGQGVIYAVSKDQGVKHDYLVGGVGSTLGMASMFINPVMPYSVPAAGMSDDALMADRANREVEGRGWLNHALSFAAVGGSGAVLWFYYKRPASSVAMNVIPGLIIGEAQIWTQPTLARDVHFGTLAISRLGVVAGPRQIALRASF